tara:strand:- start:55 stop:738 length:684 start_codon:yes stop_codon:yes gene_type:complete
MKFSKTLQRRINNAILEKNPTGFDKFWGYSIYSKDLLRSLYSTIDKAAVFRYIYLTTEDLRFISEDIIAHVMTMEFTDTRYYKAGNKKPTSAVGFLKMLFYECRNWSYITPRGDRKSERDFVLGRQYRSGMGHQNAMSQESLDWIEQSEKHCIQTAIHENGILLDDISRVRELLSNDERHALDIILLNESKLSRGQLNKLLRYGQDKATRIKRNIETAVLDCMDTTV